MTRQLRTRFSLSNVLLLGMATLAALGLAAAHPAQAQGLNGQPVHVTHLFPDQSTVVVDEGTAPVVPGGTSFTDGVATTTVTPTQVQFTFNTSTGFSGAAFNGFQIAETGTMPVDITGVILDPASNLAGFDASRISFDSRNVFANFQGLSFTPNDNVTLDIKTAAPVPEASTTASLGLMLALGLAGVAVMRRKKTAAGL